MPRKSAVPRGHFGAEEPFCKAAMSASVNLDTLTHWIASMRSPVGYTGEAYVNIVKTPAPQRLRAQRTIRGCAQVGVGFIRHFDQISERRSARSGTAVAQKHEAGVGSGTSGRRASSEELGYTRTESLFPLLKRLETSPIRSVAPAPRLTTRGRGAASEVDQLRERECDSPTIC